MWWQESEAPIESAQLLNRALHYAERAGAGADTRGEPRRRTDGGARASRCRSSTSCHLHRTCDPLSNAPCVPAAELSMFIRHPLTAAILALPEARLEGLLANDAYKPRMHRQVPSPCRYNVHHLALVNVSLSQPCPACHRRAGFWLVWCTAPACPSQAVASACRPLALLHQPGCPVAPTASGCSVCNAGCTHATCPACKRISSCGCGAPPCRWRAYARRWAKRGGAG